MKKTRRELELELELERERNRNRGAQQTSSQCSTVVLQQSRTDERENNFVEDAVKVGVGVVLGSWLL